MRDNLVLEHLRALRGDFAEFCNEVRELRTRMTSAERGLAHVVRTMASLAVGVAAVRVEMGERFDRVHDRLGRIERRLNLAAMPA
jgi:hypothetical protein